ncbi:unnamed protein product [Acanthoscelides obtectus]|uniref:Large ribosomal subunit protein mL62 n=1 Tax=Acanthoscelides obtectus TaxID=200917 RepID=A0A9P0Q596_ACAOB|nr:unnamed protein product [Acanthoscelides obtectus]CAK1638264.1 Peptidyl-tRNA hydrolase ICT1, mitochondrial [Acanthoscelides obtectus]
MSIIGQVLKNVYPAVARSVSHLQLNLATRSSSYKSSISLDKLYPTSSLKLTTPPPPPPNDKGFNGYIPVDELEITYSKSTGPGGQNVNKVNTKVDVRFNVDKVKWLSEEVKQKLANNYRSKITKDGYLIFKSDLTRSQQLNLADCLEKIRSCVRNVLVEKKEPSPETEERIRRRLEKAARERLAFKRHRSEVKNDRRANIIV